MRHTRFIRRTNSHSALIAIKRRRLIIAAAIATVLLATAASVLAISFITKWGTSGTADGQFSTPTGIGVDTAGNVYVAEGNGNRVQKFDNNGTFLLKFGIPGDVPGGFVSPSGVTVGQCGRAGESNG